jgi:hypothetical protein
VGEEGVDISRRGQNRARVGMRLRFRLVARSAGTCAILHFLLCSSSGPNQKTEKIDIRVLPCGDIDLLLFHHSHCYVNIIYKQQIIFSLMSTYTWHIYMYVTHIISKPP